MKLVAFAVDYDGTIAMDGTLDPSVREAIADVRRHGILVILVTGRRLEHLRAQSGDLACFDVVVAENGAVLHFPATDRHVLLAHRPPPPFLDALTGRGVPFVAGESIVEADARWSASILDAIRVFELPLMLAFNRGRVMVLPPAVAKSSGLREALFALRVSIHNTVGIGDAENDHDLLDACEVGAAVSWGSAALRAVADEVIDGDGPHAVAAYLRRVSQQPRLSASQMGRRRILLGAEHDGTPVGLAVRGRSILVAGEPGSGKSWLAGLICEQLILQGYCVCVLDPEGDYRSLQELPAVITLGGDDPPPHARELLRALRHPDVSVIVDLSRMAHRHKIEYLRSVLPLLMAERRRSGLPHKIVLDEAHHFLSTRESARLIDPELAGYIFITYRVSWLDPALWQGDVVVMITRESDLDEIRTLSRRSVEQCGIPVGPEVFRELDISEAALLPGAAEAHGCVRRFKLSPRLTTHVRHRQKYFDMPVVDAQAFVFTGDGTAGPRARTLKDFTALLLSLDGDRIRKHLQRHDFSRWLRDVFRDHPLAAQIERIEARVDSDEVRALIESIAQSVRARYEPPPEPVRT